MNRWRQRLGELQSELHAEPSAAVPRAAQNVRNVQNQPAAPVFEPFEQIELPEDAPAPRPTPTECAAAKWGAAEEERVAIIEHDGKIPPAWAEGFARLHPDRPPGDVPLRRWQLFVDDVGCFLDSDFCAVAAAFGWGPLDLFGCDRDRPFARIDQAGLLWLLSGGKLIALTENVATIETRTGGRQTYRCKSHDPGRVLAWELADGER
jgi:hypothetical protein